MSTESRSTSPSPKHELPSWLWAPYALYAVSAACILIGIAMIIVPIYGEQGIKVMEKFYCLIVLNIYEMALLGVALLLILFRRVLDDVIAVTLILCIFIVGSTVALDTVAPDHPDACLLFGLAGLMMAMAKLFALNRFIVGQMNLFILLGIVSWLLINSLLPGWLGLTQQSSTNQVGPVSTLVVVRRSLMDVWLVAWGSTVGGCLLVWFGLATVRTGDAGKDDIGQPFIRTAAMRAIVLGILMLGTFVHLYATTFAFSLPLGLEVMMIAVGMAALLLLELLRGYGFRFNAMDMFVALVPASLALGVGLSTRQVVHDHAIAWISDPVMFLSVFAAVLFVAALRRRHPAMHPVWMTYLMLAVLLAGVDPGAPFQMKFEAMNWPIAGLGLTAALVAFAVVSNRVWPAVLAAMVFAPSIVNLPFSLRIMGDYGMRNGMVLALAAGVWLQGVYAVAPLRLPRLLGSFSAGMVAVGVIGCLLPMEGVVATGLQKLDWYRYSTDLLVNEPMLPSAVTAVLLTGVSLRTGNRKVFLFAWLPFVLEVLNGGAGWAFVVLSFVVLGYATKVSWQKGGVVVLSDETIDVPTQVQSQGLVTTQSGASVS